MTEDSFEQVKKMMKIIGGKAVIIENGKPSFVIINADEYLDFENIKNDVQSEAQLIDKINKDIVIWKGKQKEREMRQLEKDFALREGKSRDTETTLSDSNL